MPLATREAGTHARAQAVCIVGIPLQTSGRYYGQYYGQCRADVVHFIGCAWRLAAVDTLSLRCARITLPRVCDTERTAPHPTPSDPMVSAEKAKTELKQSEAARASVDARVDPADPRKACQHVVCLHLQSIGILVINQQHVNVIGDLEMKDKMRMLRLCYMYHSCDHRGWGYVLNQQPRKRSPSKEPLNKRLPTFVLTFSHSFEKAVGLGATIV